MRPLLQQLQVLLLLLLAVSLQEQCVRCSSLAASENSTRAGLTGAAAATVVAAAAPVKTALQPRRQQQLLQCVQQQRLLQAPAYIRPHERGGLPLPAAAAPKAIAPRLTATTTAAATTAAAGTAAVPSAAAFRIGHGYDLHRLSTNPRETTGPLVLAGVSFAAEAEAAGAALQQQQHMSCSTAAALLSRSRRLLSAASSGLRRILPSCRTSNSHGSSSSSSSSSRGGLGVVAHSDGDVVLHAAADAILSAAGAPDIGQLFPDTAAANKGRDSRDFAAAAAAAAAAAGYSVAHVDVTLLLQRPSISSKKQQMAASLAAAFNLHSSQVSLKAKTAEGLGPVGRSEAVECHAVALLQRKAAHTPQ